MNRALICLLATITLDTVGMGLIMPILPDLLRKLAPQGDAPEMVANHYGYFLSLYALMQFFFSPVLGVLSDRYGRRPVLLVSLAGAAIDYVVMAFAPTLSVLYLGRIVSGITGANFAVATAYLTDISAESERAKRFGLLHACFGIGFILGPALGGELGHYSHRFPFLLAAGFNALNFAFAWLVLPESRPGSVSKPTPESESAPAGFRMGKLNLFASFRWVWGVGGLLPLLLVFFVMQIVGTAPMSLWVIYGQEQFGWDERWVGFSMAAFGALMAVAQAGLTGPLTRLLGERRLLVAALLLDGSAWVLFSMATRGWMAFAILPLLCLGGTAFPTLQSLLSKRVGEARQGELQGTLVSAMSLAAILGPLAATALYAATAQTHPGLVWVAAAAMYVFCLPALWGRQPEARVAT